MADEINRAPSKVQSALLEAMQERQVTIGEETFQLEDPFLVMATQNPLEQEGTYHLPEAQLDRFLLKTVISYPKESEEIQIMKNESLSQSPKIEKIMTKKDIHDIQKFAEQIHVSDTLFDYVKDIVFASRFPSKYGLENIANFIDCGASPRASIALIKTAKILALMHGRDHVIPEDVKEIANDVLRHRIIANYEALAEEVTSDDIVKSILENVVVP